VELRTVAKETSMLWNCRAALVAVVLAALALAAAPADAAEAGVGGCPSSTLEQPFAPWLDPFGYVLVPNGGFESGAAGWTLGWTATVAPGNESFSVGGAHDSRSLSLPPSSSATSSGICVDGASPDLRLFVKNTGSLLSTLAVEVLYTDALGEDRAITVARVAGGSSWQPTPPIPLLANLTALPLVTNGTTTLAFRFRAEGVLGVLGGWRIDDVYVDPFKGE
jgi:hypothetical protein